jgi:hypothetical protein
MANAVGRISVGPVVWIVESNNLSEKVEEWYPMLLAYPYPQAKFLANKANEPSSAQQTPICITKTLAISTKPIKTRMAIR